MSGAAIRATIVMRARDEAPRIGAALDGALRQRDVSLEVVVVDSGSRDGTLEVVRSRPVRLIEIPPESFTFSHALNVGAAAGTGTYVVCLNADAEPVGERWLAELLRPLEEDPTVAAAYSRQLPRPRSRVTVLRDYAWAFGHSAPAADPPFFSMVASAYRRSLWEQHPFWSDGGAGDDIEWVRWATQRGWRVAYAPASQVVHSHDYSAGDWFRKTRREHRIAIGIYGRRAAWGPAASLARLPLEWLRDARFAARRGAWAELPAAAVHRTAQAAGRVAAWLETRPRGERRSAPEAARESVAGRPAAGGRP